jgi:TRAP transporter 4TM/12TM fusion protein
MSTPILALFRLYSAVLLIGGLLWALDVPSRLGFSLIEPEWLGPYLGVATATAFLQVPYRRTAGALEAVLGFAAIASWFWLAINYGAWLFDVEGYTAEKFVPGIIGIALMTEAVRKTCGLAIAVLIAVMIVYALVGAAFTPPLQADAVSPQLLVMYLYSDTNAIPGLVLGIVASVVLAFIIFGKLMEVSGATQFFNDIAMSLMGHRRGGSAKISVTASALMGSISGSPVSNIMSTGTVTIPLMKRMGFKGEQAAAIEAVASTGGQITPPIMGATAFLMAEFLQIDYAEVALAATIPALLFYVCIFMQVDAIAKRNGLSGLPKSELPRMRQVMREGWIFVLPFVLLIYLLFFEALAAQFAAVAASALLLALAFIRGKLRTAAEWKDLIFDGGAMLVSLILVAGAAGVVVGVMNISGLGQSIATILVEFGSSWGLLAMLALTAVLSIVLGMGMPATAIYVVLASIIAPALIEMGVTPMGAHLFIFYFGVLSFLTPPVAVASYVAAGLADADMWKTGWVGMQMSVVAFLLPFIWAYDPGLLLQGSMLGIVTVTATTLVGIMLIAKSLRILKASNPATIASGVLFLAAIVTIITSPIWLGAGSPWGLAAAGAGLLLYYAWPERTAAA